MKYPRGYNKFLGDGFRFGEPEKPIEVWHDWYALATLMFQLHKPAKTALKSHKDALDEIREVWLNSVEDPGEKDIADLKAAIEKFDVPSKPSLTFKRELEKVMGEGTLHWATGSPAEKPGP